jgi:hypothetical protein
MMRVFFAVFEQVATQLLYVAFRQSDLFPRLKIQLDGFGLTGHFLRVPRIEGFDFKIG